jgi:hypothetical protein
MKTRLTSSSTHSSTEQLKKSSSESGLDFFHTASVSLSIYTSQLMYSVPTTVRSAINGHLAWTVQNATGNRGDDVRALKISELQPYEMLHPNNVTPIFCVLGLQGEEKAGLKGMQSVCRGFFGIVFLNVVLMLRSALIQCIRS